MPSNNGLMLHRHLIKHTKTQGLRQIELMGLFNDSLMHQHLKIMADIDVPIGAHLGHEYGNDFLLAIDP